jgi:23S rRNA (cytidine1920-2'-O)/16S rRNA (cytidine1409-2'-O)-methyltransferase
MSPCRTGSRTAGSECVSALRHRLDSELVLRGLARSRRHAADLVVSGRVFVDELPVTKTSTPVAAEQQVAVENARGVPDFASRGGYKLAGVLDRLGPGGPQVDGRSCLDAGASTGGFTDVLLRRGARHVLAVDVGHDQLLPALRSDPRVTSWEGVNLRHLDPSSLPAPVDLVVADLSFISLTLVLPVLAACARPGADLLVMVKPQFEVGRERLGSGGVVRDAGHREQAVATVAECARDHGLVIRAIEASPLPGPGGNIEYFLWLVSPAGNPAGVPGPDPGLDGSRLQEAIRAAVARGSMPQEGGAA